MKTKIILLLILATAFFIRFYQHNYPPLLWDEAALGYNAFSLLKTGKDEFGQFLPLIFKSFGDYKPGAYIYLSLPFIYLFGLNELSVRLPSIIFGTLGVYLIYLITKKQTKSELISLSGALLASLSPYLILQSRQAWETNVSGTFILAMVYLFIVYLKKPTTKLIFIISLLASISVYTYQSAKLTTSVLLVIFTFLSLKFNKKYLFVLWATFFILTLRIWQGTFLGADTNRLKVVSIFSYPRPDREITTIKNEVGGTNYTIFYSQPIFLLRNILTRYANHFSPQFLFFLGDWQNSRHSAPYVGVLLYSCIPLLLFGFIYLIKNLNQKSYFIIFCLLLLGPLPASLTRDSVQSVRSVSFSYSLILTSIFGLHYLNFLLRHKLQKFIFLFIFFTATFISFVYYSDMYYNHMLKKSPKELLLGYKEAVLYVKSHRTPQSNVFFTDFYGQPHIYYAFYTNMSPKLYQSQIKLVENISGDTGKVEYLDGVNFTSVSYSKCSVTPNSICIFSHDEVLRQNIPISNLSPLSPVRDYSTFYAYQN